MGTTQAAETTQAVAVKADFAIPPDHAQRELALDPASSFIVQAPAGSGKTELLVQRMLTLLAVLESPEELLAITFTRKAAAEMRQRLLDALEQASRPEPTDAGVHARRTRELAQAVLEQDRRQGWALAHNPSRLRLQTIDGLCASLCRRMPLAAGPGAVLAISDDAAALYQEAARRTLRLLAEQGPWQTALQILLVHLDNDLVQAEALLIRLLVNREQWLRHMIRARNESLDRATLEAGLAGIIEDRLAGLRALFPPHCERELLVLARYAAANLRGANSMSMILGLADLQDLPGACAEHRQGWQAIAELLLTSTGVPRRRFDRTIGFDSPTAKDAKAIADEYKARMALLLEALKEHAPLLSMLHAARSLPPPRYEDAQWKVLEALTRLLPVLVAQLLLVFKERGRVDYPALSHAALRALEDEDGPTDLALALDYRIRHILVDEFQDTSQVQFRLIEGLTAGWQAGDGRTLFLVGDPMQSIYRFREADVSLFLRARDIGIGGLRLQALSLTANFRAQAGLVSWINDHFARVFPATDESEVGAVAYAASTAVLPALAEQAVCLQVVAGADAAEEARCVARTIELLRRQHPGGSIAVLVSSRGHLGEILPLLRARSIATAAVEIDALKSRPVVRDLLALTRALLHPADRIAWLAVLRAPWCGLGLADLEGVAAYSRHGGLTISAVLQQMDCLEELSVEGADRIRRVMTIIGRFTRDRQRHSTRRWIEAAWLALGGPATADQAHELSDAEAYFDLVESVESETGKFDPARLLARMDGLFARSAPDGPDAVQVMTMHGAKGLEFDFVVVPGLGRKGARDAQPLLRWLERPRPDGRGDLLLAPLGARRDAAEPIYRTLSQIDRQRSDHEARRLLYVAATRARRALHLIGGVRPDKDAVLKPLAGSLLAHLWGSAAGEARRVESPSNGDSDARKEASGLWRFRRGWQPPLPPLSVLKLAEPARPAAAVMEEAPIEFSWVSQRARLVGVAVHRALQRIAVDGLDAWSDSTVARMGPVLQAHLRMLGAVETSLPDAVTRAQQALLNVLRDERGRWLLQDHTEAHAEYRLTADIGGELVAVAIDRTFVHAGVRWVIDYKTSVHEGGALADFLDTEQGRYRVQMERYAVVLRQAGESRPIWLALYFPMLQQWRAWLAAA